MRGAHLARSRCARCGGVLGPDDAPHDRCAEPRERMTKVLVSLDTETIEALDRIGPTRSAAVREAVRYFAARRAKR